ncbi:hypothetical protein L208DRAFT_1241536, partial [Tricholoma matsutake]
LAELLFLPLGQALYEQDFRRGSVFSDRMSIFFGNDVSTAQIFSITGEVKPMHFDQGGPVLLLGKPSLCGAVTNLFWWQQVLVLEKVKLADLSVD